MDCTIKDEAPANTRIDLKPVLLEELGFIGD
jgi:hypothetical protein